MAKAFFLMTATYFSLVTFVKFVILLLIFTMLIATVTLIERKVLALTQRRVGPNYIGYRGRLQFIADAVKLIVKHITIIARVNRSLFLLVPAVLLICVYLFWANLVWAPNLAICEIEYNLLWMGVLSGFFSYFLILAGFITNNKYAMMSSARVVVMSFTLEILLNLFFILLALASNNLSLATLGSLNSNIGHILLILPAFPIVLVTLLLEVNRTPFDLAEAESELIAGYTVEYGGFFFVLFYLGEYFHLFCSSTFFVTALFGAWTLNIMLTVILSSLLDLCSNTMLKWLYVDFSDMCFLFVLAVATWSFFTVVSFRYKIYYFILSLIVVAIWGFGASFDGLILMMLVTEFTVAMFFIFLFITAKFKKERTPINPKWFFLYVTLLYALYFFAIEFSYSTYFFFFSNIYPYTHDIVAHDLAIIYWFVLYFNPLVTIHISVILGLFSIFFICVFFTLKHLNHVKNKQPTLPEDVVTLRKQLLFHQNRYDTRIRIFQSNNVPKRQF
jgi:NADH-quinone oxidoreductase subunit H